MDPTGVDGQTDRLTFFPSPAAPLSGVAGEEPQLAELGQLRYFGGLTLNRCAEALGVSARTADTWWSQARAWLAVELADR